MEGNYLIFSLHKEGKNFEARSGNIRGLIDFLEQKPHLKCGF
jgi:hypothetical protein